MAKTKNKLSEEEMLAMKAEEKIRRKFNKGCVDYHLLEDGDRILIAISGGKDSLVLARLLAERSRIFRPSIKIEAAHVVMDNIPYETDRSFLQSFCDTLGIKLHILHSQFDENTDKRKTHCFLCAWNRRKTLFTFAQANGFNKIALGHHQDDILTTWLMNMTYEGSASPTMPPALQMEHYPITIIRPLCLVDEQSISQLSMLLHFLKLKTPCPYEETSRRSDMNKVFRHLETLNPEARHSLWTAMMQREK